MTIILSNLNQLKKITGRFLGKFVVKRILKIQTHLAYMLLHYLVKQRQQNKPSKINYKVV